MFDEHYMLHLFDHINVNDAADTTDAFDSIIDNSDQLYLEMLGREHTVIRRYIDNNIATEIYWYDSYYIYFTPNLPYGFNINVYELNNYTLIDEDICPPLVFGLDFNLNFDVVRFNFEGLINSISDSGFGDELNTICNVLVILGLITHRNRNIGFIHNEMFCVQPLMFGKPSMGY